MAGIFATQRFAQQPQQAVPVDRGNALCGGLVHSWGLNVLGGLAAYDAAGKAQGVFGSGASGSPSGNSWQIGPAGYYLNYDDTGTGTTSSVSLAVGNSSGSGSPGSNNFSITARVRLQTYTGTGANVGGPQCLYGSGVGGLEVRINTSGRIEVLQQSTASLGTSSSTVPLGVDVDVGVSYDGSTIRFYLNGLPVGTAAASAKTFSQALQYYLGFGTVSGGAFERLANGSRLYRLDVWSRALAASEFKAWSANPWQVYKAPMRRTWLQAQANIYTLTASAGTFAIGGASAGLTAVRRLQASASSFAVSAAFAGLITTRCLSAVSAAFALTGSTARLLAARALRADAGSYTLMGTAPSLRAARRLAPSAGVFALTGAPVQMVYTPTPGPGGPTYTLTAVAGAFAMAGGTAGVLARRRLGAASGAFVWSGAAAPLLVGRRMLTSTGTFVATGGSVTMRAARYVPARTGTFSLTGADVQLHYSAQVTYARALDGPGYVPQQHYNESRPAASNVARPAALQRNYR